MEWDINDATIPNTVNHYDAFQDWADDHIRLVYTLNSEPARRHSSGWAMRNTNNHNVHILKKSCLGVLMCSQRCKLGPSGTGELRLRPAICDKARKKQLGRPCPNPKCIGGSLILVACKGNSGFPCTHFWRHTGNAIFFQAKGVHDHPRPEVKNSNVEVRKTIGMKRSSSSSHDIPFSTTSFNISKPKMTTNSQTRGKVGRKSKMVKKELFTEPTPNSHPTPIGTTLSKKLRISHPPQLPPPPKPHPIPQNLPLPILESNNLNLNFPTTSDYSYHSNNSKPPFPEWYYPHPHHHQEEVQVAAANPPQKQYPSTTTCPGCNQPHFYCSCGFYPHPHSNEFLQSQPQHSEPVSGSGPSGGGFISFNNNQDTFKPSDIFNFEVNLNLNYSAYTTNHHYHPNNNSNSNVNQGGLVPHSSYYNNGSGTGGGVGGCAEEHFLQPNQHNNQQSHHNPNPNHQYYNASLYDGYWTNNGSSIHNVNNTNGSDMLYQ